MQEHLVQLEELIAIVVAVQAAGRGLHIREIAERCDDVIEVVITVAVRVALESAR